MRQNTPKLAGNEAIWATVRREAMAACQTPDAEIGPAQQNQMPQTEAFILEVQRLSSVLPICPPRLVTSDIKVPNIKVNP